TLPLSEHEKDPALRTLSHVFFFSSRRRHTRSVSAFLLNRSSDLKSVIRGLMVTVCPSQFATRRTLFHVLVGCGLLMLKVSRLKRSEERRVGKEGRSRRSTDHYKKNRISAR